MKPHPNTTTLAPALEYLFHPESIAVAGVSTDMTKVGPGRFFIEALREQGYAGRLYGVGRHGGEHHGVPIYPSLMDIPGTVDYVISSVPAAQAPALLRDCAAKGVRAVHLFTAGFAEISERAGARLQAELITLAREFGIRLLGPNCMGIFCPETGLSFERVMTHRSGHVGFVSQSGGNAIKAIQEAENKGIHFSKIISYGNAADLDESDFIDYLTDDPATEIITAYIEGVCHGRKFYAALRRAAAVKPVIVYKGGIGESGHRAVASHTGAIGGTDRVWAALLRQANAIPVQSLEEMLDVVALCHYLGRPKGLGAGIIGIGGGNNVLATDDALRAGLTVPPFPPGIRRDLKKIYTSEAGASFRNPVDMYFAKFGLAEETIRVVARCRAVDLIIVHITVGWTPAADVDLARNHVQMVAGLAEKVDKPVIAVLRPFGATRYLPVVSELEQILNRGGLPVFLSVGDAARAYVRFHDYHRRR